MVDSTWKNDTKDYWRGVIAPFAVAGTMVVASGTLVFRAYVTAKLWNWYVAPALNVSPLSIAYAFGISLLLRYALTTTNPENKEKWHFLLSRSVAAAAIVLLVGWLGTLFI